MKPLERPFSHKRSNDLDINFFTFKPV